MAVLSTKSRKSLPKGDFAIPSKAPVSGSYPIPDRSHAQNALSRVSANGSPAEKAEVRAKVHSKYPDMGKPSSSGSKSSAHDGTSGMDKALSAHADQMHPVRGR